MDASGAHRSAPIGKRFKEHEWCLGKTGSFISLHFLFTKNTNITRPFAIVRVQADKFIKKKEKMEKHEKIHDVFLRFSPVVRV